MHLFNSCIHEAEADISLCFQDQSGIHSEFQAPQDYIDLVSKKIIYKSYETGRVKLG